MWPANHVFDSPHPLLGYIIGVGISLDRFSLFANCNAKYKLFGNVLFKNMMPGIVTKFVI